MVILVCAGQKITLYIYVNMSCITVCCLKCLLDNEKKCHTVSCHRSTFDSILGHDRDKLRIKGKLKLFVSVLGTYDCIEVEETSRGKYPWKNILPFRHCPNHTHTPPPSSALYAICATFVTYIYDVILYLLSTLCMYLIVKWPPKTLDYFEIHWFWREIGTPPPISKRNSVFFIDISPKFEIFCLNPLHELKWIVQQQEWEKKMLTEPVVHCEEFLLVADQDVGASPEHEQVLIYFKKNVHSAQPQYIKFWGKIMRNWGEEQFWNCPES